MVWLILNLHSTDSAFTCKPVSDKSVQRPIITGWLKQTHFWWNTVVVKRPVILDCNCDHAVVRITITMFFFCINHHYHSFRNHGENQQNHVPHHPHSKSCWHCSHTTIYINYSYLERLNYTWYTMEVPINSTISSWSSNMQVVQQIFTMWHFNMQYILSPRYINTSKHTTVCNSIFALKIIISYGLYINCFPSDSYFR